MCVYMILPYKPLHMYIYVQPLIYSRHICIYELTLPPLHYKAVYDNACTHLYMFKHTYPYTIFIRMHPSPNRLDVYKHACTHTLDVCVCTCMHPSTITLDICIYGHAHTLPLPLPPIPLYEQPCHCFKRSTPGNHRPSLYQTSFSACGRCGRLPQFIIYYVAPFCRPRTRLPCQGLYTHSRRRENAR